MKLSQKIAFAIPAVLLFGFWIYAQGERCCFFAPAIDTTFASGFSEDAFAKVKPGMQPDEVVAILGPPLYKNKGGQGENLWWYSKDGRCWWGDWAYLARCVEFEGTTVRSADGWVAHD